MTELLNPIYDASFKYLMEDQRAAKVLLSALLRRKVTDIRPMAHEHVDKTRDRETGKDLGIYRLDYSAMVETSDGSQESVCIELQKVWYETEIYRFRKYLGGQYSDPSNVEDGTGVPRHIIAIYLLGHTISETDSPIAYSHGGTLTDYDGRPIAAGGSHGGYGGGKFVRSLTHDVVIVQIPRLPARPRNAAERILSVFDQRRMSPSDYHVIEVPDDCQVSDDALTMRLRIGLADRSVRAKMDIEMEFQQELETRSAELRQAKAMLEANKKELATNKKELEASQKELATSQKELVTSQKELVTSQKELEASQKELEASQKELATNKKELEASQKELATSQKELDANKKELDANKKELDANKKELDANKKELEKNRDELVKSREESLRLVRSSAIALSKAGMAVPAIAATLGVGEDVVKSVLSNGQ